MRDFKLELSFLPYELVLISCHIPFLRRSERKMDIVKNIQDLVAEVQSTVGNFAGDDGIIAKRCENVRKTFGINPVNECRRFRGDEARKIDCPGQSGALVGLGFGKGDVTLLLRSPNLYWGSRIRAEIEGISGIRETYALPCHRVYFEGPQGQSSEEMELKVNPEFPLWTSYFLRPEYDGADPVTFRQTRKPPVSGTRMRDILQDIAKLISKQNPKQTIQMFISYDNQRILVQGGFKDWDSAYRFQDELRDIPNINAVRSRPWLPVNNSREMKKWKDYLKEEPKPVTCKILLSMAGNAEALRGALTRIENSLKTDLENDTRIDPKPGHMQAGFWSGVLTVKTYSLRWLTYCVLKDIVNEDAVKSVRTIPCVDMEDIDESEYDEAGHEFGNVLPHNYSKPGLRGLGNVDDWTLLSTAPDPCERILLYQLFTRKYEAEWLAYNARQIAMEWTTRLQLPKTIFFDRFMLTVQNELNKNDALMQNPNDVLVNRNPLRKLPDLARQVSAVQAVYSEHLEGAQVTSLTDPDVRVGNQACLLPLMIQAVDRLMVQYMGYIREDKLTGVGNHHFPRTWYGISSTWTGHDLSIRPGTMLLQLPIYVRLVPGDVLPLICHEAAHIHFELLFPFSKYRNILTKPLKKTEFLKLREVQQVFCGIYWKFVNDIAKNLNQYGYNYFRAFTERYQIKLDIVLRELFVDIIAALIGSSGYFACLARNNSYWGNFTDKDNRPVYFERSRVNIGLRANLGLWMNETMGIDERWNTPLRSINECLKRQEAEQELMVGKKPTTRLTDAYWNSHDYDFAMMLALESVIKETDVLQYLKDFFTIYYDVNPLFLSKKDQGNRASRDAYKNCSKIVKGILKEDALLMDYEPRDIVAALELPVRENGVTYRLKRPMFPIGNVWMSLIYSKTSAAEDRTSQIT